MKIDDKIFYFDILDRGDIETILSNPITEKIAENIYYQLL